MTHLIFTLIKIFLAILFGKKIIISRCACLGLDVLRGLNGVVINRQKFRVDLPWRRKLIDIATIFSISNKSIKPSIKDLVIQQSFNIWTFAIKKADYFVIDTYSELTDRFYVYKQSKFCCHKGDFREGYKNNFSPGELIDSEALKRGYSNFFLLLQEINPSIKIIALIFPVKYDSRYIYKKQYENIKIALQECININIIELEDSEIHKSHLDSFPYHFDDITINNFRSKVLYLMQTL